jgi:hypothetical protein
MIIYRMLNNFKTLTCTRAVFDNFTIRINEISTTFWGKLFFIYIKYVDTSGSHLYDRLRTLCYPGTDGTIDLQ